MILAKLASTSDTVIIVSLAVLLVVGFIATPIGRHIRRAKSRGAR